MELNLIVGVALIFLGAIIKPIQIVMSRYVSTQEQKDKIRSNKTLPFLSIAYILLGLVVVVGYYLFKSIGIDAPIDSIATLFIVIIGVAMINTISIKFK